MKIVISIPRKRDVLIFIASIYDPLGLINPFDVKLKLLFQKLNISKMGWNSYLEKESLLEWQIITNDLLLTGSISLPRCYIKHLDITLFKLELHGLADASNKAYGYCVYLRFFNETCSFSIIVTSKSRVTSVFKSTIPRLELSSNLLLAEFLYDVQNEIKSVYDIYKVTCWADSTICLHWINNTTKKYEIFIQNKPNKIRSLYDITSWKYVESYRNPADIISRGYLVSDCSSASAIRGLKRFFTRQGVPSEIVSDNGTQFASEETQGFVALVEIKWQMNVAAASWWSRVFERLIRSKQNDVI
ncbi:uncharacterized protein LOC136092747 [Hydra vulgaris]|uniref:uncharacterized protein LOC136092747 n=1 Tax=Hydra vulgaris TaxID=6087 RepID=UPI0032E9C3FB